MSTQYIPLPALPTRRQVIAKMHKRYADPNIFYDMFRCLVHDVLFEFTGIQVNKNDQFCNIFKTIDGLLLVIAKFLGNVQRGIYSHQITKRVLNRNLPNLIQTFACNNDWGKDVLLNYDAMEFLVDYVMQDQPANAQCSRDYNNFGNSKHYLVLKINGQKTEERKMCFHYRVDKGNAEFPYVVEMISLNNRVLFTRFNKIVL